MPYADLEARKACVKRYHAKPGVKARTAALQRARIARLYAEKPDEIRAQRREWARRHYHKSRVKTILREARKRAAEKGLPFNLTPEDIITPEFCPVLGYRLETGSGTRRDQSPSLDRVIPSLGYVKGNVRVISWRANRLKLDATIEEMEAVLAYMKKEQPAS